MTPLPPNFRIPAPYHLASSDARPAALAQLDVRDLCELAGIPSRTSGPLQDVVVLHAEISHLRAPGVMYVGLNGVWQATPVSALRVLEVLAHGFHDYAAREAVCGHGYFKVAPRRGRPRSARAVPAKERMRKMRDRAKINQNVIA